MAEDSRASARLFKRAIEYEQELRRDVIQGRERAPFGFNYRAVTVDEECDSTVLVASANPGVAVCPGTRVAVLAIDGGSSRLVIEAAPPGRSGSLPIEFQEESADVGLAAGGFLALKIATYDPPNATIDIGSFALDGSFNSVLFSGLAITGIDGGSENASRRQLLSCRSIVGLSGIPDGSLAFWTFDENAADEAAFTMHTVNATTGLVAERVVAPGFTPFSEFNNIAGMEIFNGSIYIVVVWNEGLRVQVIHFPAGLGSQTIDNDQTGLTVFDFLIDIGALFYPNTDVIIPTDLEIE